MNSFQVKLTSAEVLVIAALLGYESLFGVEDDVFSDPSTDMKALVQHQVRKMERKKLIRYDLDGILYVVPGLRQAITCICNAENVGRFSTNLKSGKKAYVYVLKKDGMVAMLERLGDGKYLITLTDTIPMEEIVPNQIRSSACREVKEKMLIEEAEFVHKLMESFDEDGAKIRIGKHIKDSSAADLIAKILAGNCAYMSVQIHRKGQGLYNAVDNMLLVCVEGATVSLYLDENGMVRFEGQSPSEITDRIHSQLEFA